MPIGLKQAQPRTHAAQGKGHNHHLATTATKGMEERCNRRIGELVNW